MNNLEMQKATIEQLEAEQKSVKAEIKQLQYDVYYNAGTLGQLSVYVKDIENDIEKLESIEHALKMKRIRNS